MVGIKDIKLMFVQHQKVLCCLTRLHDSKIVSVLLLLQGIKNQHMLFSVADAVYDSQLIYKIAGTCDIFLINPINQRNDEQIKSSHLRWFSHFVNTTVSQSQR